MVIFLTVTAWSKPSSPARTGPALLISFPAAVSILSPHPSRFVRFRVERWGFCFFGCSSSSVASGFRVSGRRHAPHASWVLVLWVVPVGRRKWSDTYLIAVADTETNWLGESLLRWMGTKDERTRAECASYHWRYGQQHHRAGARCPRRFRTPKVARDSTTKLAWEKLPARWRTGSVLVT